MDHGNPVSDISQYVPEPICPVLGARKHEDGVLVLSQERHEEIGLAVMRRMVQALCDTDSRSGRA